MKRSTKRLTISGLLLAIALFLPFLTGQIQYFGKMLAPMHIPALLCGFLCGWPYGLAMGFVAPILRSVLFGMPPMVPTAWAMAFELATYGAMAAVLYNAFKRTTPGMFVALILSMLVGRVVWGLAMWALMAAQGGAFTFQMFVAGAFVDSALGIAVHIVLIPAIMVLLRRARLLDNI